VHRHHILDLTYYPARVTPATAEGAHALTERICRELRLVGLLCVEFFLTQDRQLLVNELAPRPHNSGHITLEASVTNQFQQLVRAVAGWPLGASEEIRPGAMANLLGEHVGDTPQ